MGQLDKAHNQLQRQVAALEADKVSAEGRLADLQTALMNKAADMAETVARLKQVRQGRT